MQQTIGNKAQVEVYKFNDIEYYSVSGAAQWLGMRTDVIIYWCRERSCETHSGLPKVVVEHYIDPNTKEVYVPKRTIEIIAERLNLYYAWIARKVEESTQPRNIDFSSI